MDQVVGAHLEDGRREVVLYRRKGLHDVAASTPHAEVLDDFVRRNRLRSRLELEDVSTVLEHAASLGRV